MRGTTHILGGATFAISLSTFCGVYAPVSVASDNKWLTASLFGIYLSGACTGAILPDIEKKGSTISNKHKIISFFLRIVMSHRGITHSLLAMVLVGAALFPFGLLLPNGIGYAYMIGTMIGYGSHLVLDSLNPTGVPYFYPFIETKYSFGKITTGGFIERLFFVGLSFAFLLLVRFSLYEQFVSIGLIEKASRAIDNATSFLR